MIGPSELCFYEHVVAEDASVARWQRRADAVWSRRRGRGHLQPDTAAAIESASLESAPVRRFWFSTSLFDRVAAPLIVGVAHRR